MLAKVRVCSTRADVLSCEHAVSPHKRAPTCMLCRAQRQGKRRDNCLRHVVVCIVLCVAQLEGSCRCVSVGEASQRLRSGQLAPNHGDCTMSRRVRIA
jgi:hypothetical protein